VTGDADVEVAVVSGLAEVMICPVDVIEDETLELLDVETLLLSNEERLELIVTELLLEELVVVVVVVVVAPVTVTKFALTGTCDA
jgi:hypothetical protein